MTEITIPDGMTPADIVGDTDILPGQEWLSRTGVIAFTRQIQNENFPWEMLQDEQPMAVEVGTNGKVLTQGHHRFVAARLAKVELPVAIEFRYDYLKAGQDVPFAKSWEQVKWED